MSYTIKPTSVTDFYEGFLVHPPKIEGQPTYDDLRRLRDALYANAAAIPSTQGGGNHGHLGMIMDPVVYATLSPVAWVNPPQPVMPPLGAMTAAQISEANRRFAEESKAHIEAQNLDKALIRLISQAISEIYLKPIYQPYVGLLNRTAYYVITWLITSYGRLLPHDLVDQQGTTDT